MIPAFTHLSVTRNLVRLTSIYEQQSFYIIMLIISANVPVRVCHEFCSHVCECRSQCVQIYNPFYPEQPLSVHAMPVKSRAGMGGRGGGGEGQKIAPDERAGPVPSTKIAFRTSSIQ